MLTWISTHIPFSVGTALTLLAALSRLWPYIQRIFWFRVPQVWRPWLSTVPILIGCVAGVLATPADWVAQAEALLIVVTPLLIPGATPTEGKLLLFIAGMLGLKLNACSATLEETRPKAPLIGISVAGVQMLTPGSPKCLSLSEKQHLWNGLALGSAALGLSGLAGTIIEQATRDGKDQVVLYSTLIAGGMFGAAAEVAREIAEGYRSDYQSLGCAAP